MCRRYPVILLVFCISLSAMAFSLLSSGCGSDNSRSLSETEIPADAGVVIRANTQTASGALQIGTRSVYYFYDEEGSFLCRSAESEEQFGTCMIHRGKKIGFFLRNKTIIKSEKTVVFEDYPEEAKINGTRFGTSVCGYVKNTETFFALRNVGKKSNDVPYINTIRFANSDRSYDVVLPWHLETICYNTDRDCFYCPLSFMNEEHQSVYLVYAIVSFDSTVKQYKLDSQLTAVKNPELEDKAMPLVLGYRASGNVLYQYMIVPDDPEQPQGTGALIKSSYDTDSQKLLENETIVSGMELGVYGGIIAGSGTLPATEYEGKMYLFTAEEKVYIDSDEGTLSLDLPYPFDQYRSLSSPLTPASERAKYKSQRYLAVNLKIMEDGNLYVLALSEEKKLQIFRLTNDSTYEHFWEGDLPGNFGKDLAVGDYEIFFTE